MECHVALVHHWTLSDTPARRRNPDAISSTNSDALRSTKQRPWFLTRALKSGHPGLRPRWGLCPRYYGAHNSSERLRQNGNWQYVTSTRNNMSVHTPIMAVLHICLHKIQHPTVNSRYRYIHIHNTLLWYSTRCRLAGPSPNINRIPASWHDPCALGCSILQTRQETTRPPINSYSDSSLLHFLRMFYCVGRSAEEPLRGSAPLTIFIVLCSNSGNLLRRLCADGGRSRADGQEHGYLG
ncbi:hypothetical protein K438DRAFT_1050803 [Mycena galopus ATCC 62051]|nr:hypothetical protein K438DRAFT_1050803 [Mycena galopus ATCC 62051]